MAGFSYGVMGQPSEGLETALRTFVCKQIAEACWISVKGTSGERLTGLQSWLMSLEDRTRGMDLGGIVRELGDLSVQDGLRAWREYARGAANDDDALVPP